MNKQKLTKFLQSFVAIPMLAIAAPLSGVTPIPSPTVVLSTNTPASEASVITPQIANDSKERAEKIDTFFESRSSPLAGYGNVFVAQADANGIDWRLLPAIATRESNAGKQACKKAANSVFGYGSCKMSFKSIDESIKVVSESLGGNNPHTAQHYDGKTTPQILRKYNSVIGPYPKQVMNIMKMIDSDQDIS